MDIKKLRIEAINLINKYIKNIDKRQLDKLQKIAIFSRKPKVEQLINDLNNKINTIKDEINNNNRKKNLKTTIIKPVKNLKKEKKNKPKKDNMKKTNNKKNNPLDMNINDEYDDIKDLFDDEEEYKPQPKKEDEEEQQDDDEEEENKEDDEKIKLYIKANVKVEYVNISGRMYPKDDIIKFYIEIDKEYKNNEKYILESILKEIDEHGEKYIQDPVKDTLIINDIILINHEYLTEDEFENFNPNDLFMNNSNPPNIINIDIKYEYEEHKCVYGALKARYGWNEDYLFNIFNEYVNKCNNNLSNIQQLDYIDDEDDNNKVEYKKREYEDFNKETGVNTNMLMYLAKKKDFSLYAYDWNNNIFNKYISKNQNLSPLVYIMANNHMYLITDENYIKSIAMRNRDLKSLCSNLFREEEIKGDTFELDIHDNILVYKLPNYNNCNIIYSCNSLDDIHYKIYKKYNDIIINVRTRGNKIIYMYYEKYKLHLHADINYDNNLNIDYKTVMEICKKINIPFTNQSISNIMASYEKSFYGLSKARKMIKKADKDIILLSQDNRCNKCGIDISKRGSRHFDHIQPLSADGTNEISNIQALCISCHLDKTKIERETNAYNVNVNPSESSFNNILSKIFDDNNAKSWAFIELIDKKPSKMYKYQKYIDINKCRRNLLLNNKHKFPVYTVLDKPEIFNKKNKIKVGYYYIKTNNHFPLRGCGWYSHVMVKYCLEEKIISLDNITHKLIPSLMVEGDYFKPFINSVIEKFDIITKQAPNFFIGCMNKQSNVVSSVSFTTDKFEAMNEYYRNNTDGKFIEDLYGNLFKIFKKKEIEFDSNRVPIYNQILQTEAIELHKLYKLIKNKGGHIYYLNTDACLCYFKKEEDYKGFDTDYYWDDNKTVLKYKFEMVYENNNNQNEDKTELINKLNELKEAYNNRIVNEDIEKLAKKRKNKLIFLKKNKINCIKYIIKDNTYYSKDDLKNYKCIVRNLIRRELYTFVDNKYCIFNEKENDETIDLYRYEDNQYILLDDNEYDINDLINNKLYVLNEKEYHPYNIDLYINENNEFIKLENDKIYQFVSYSNDELQNHIDKCDNMFDEKILNVGYDSIDIYYKNKIRVLNKKINDTVDYDLNKLNKKILIRMPRGRVYDISKDSSNYTIPEININRYEDSDNFNELVDNIIKSKKSFSIQGRAGTGKSTLSNLLVDKLKNMGKNVITMAPTNKAALVVKGMTIDKYINTYFSTKSDLIEMMKDVEYILVDEISMMKELQYKTLLTIKKMFKRVKIILVGDFGQLKPVADRVGIVDYKNSPVYFELCDNNILTLTKCRRSDDILYNMCLPENIYKVKPTHFGNKICYNNLSYTNKKRIEINDICMKRFIEVREKERKNIINKLEIKKIDYDANSQDMIICAGMPVISHVNDKSYNIVNNQTFLIHQIVKKSKINLGELKTKDNMIEYIKKNKDLVDKKTLKNIQSLNKDDIKQIIKDINKTNVDNYIELIDDINGDIVMVSIEDFQKIFYVAFCITVHRSQGQTYDKPYTIHEWYKYDNEMKYVALSRAKDIKLINIHD